MSQPVPITTYQCKGHGGITNYSKRLVSLGLLLLSRFSIVLTVKPSDQLGEFLQRMNEIQNEQDQRLMKMSVRRIELSTVKIRSLLQALDFRYTGLSMADCNSDEECQKVGFSMICKSEKCTCGSNLIYVENNWVKTGCYEKSKLFTQCITSEQCTVMNRNTYCNPNNLCTCSAGYYFDGRECIIRYDSNLKAQEVYKAAVVAAACFIVAVVGIFVACIVRRSFCRREQQVQQSDSSRNSDVFTVSDEIAALRAVDKPPSYEEVLQIERTFYGIPPPEYSDVRSRNTVSSQDVISGCTTQRQIQQSIQQESTPADVHSIASPVANASCIPYVAEDENTAQLKNTQISLHDDESPTQTLDSSISNTSSVASGEIPPLPPYLSPASPCCASSMLPTPPPLEFSSLPPSLTADAGSFPVPSITPLPLFPHLTSTLPSHSPRVPFTVPAPSSLPASPQLSSHWPQRSLLHHLPLYSQEQAVQPSLSQPTSHLQSSSSPSTSNVHSSPLTVENNVLSSKEYTASKSSEADCSSTETLITYPNQRGDSSSGAYDNPSFVADTPNLCTLTHY